MVLVSGIISTIAGIFLVRVCVCIGPARKCIYISGACEVSATLDNAFMNRFPTFMWK